MITDIEDGASGLVLDFMKNIQKLLNTGVHVLSDEVKLAYFLTNAVLSNEIGSLKMIGKIVSKSSSDIIGSSLEFTTKAAFNPIRTIDKLGLNFKLKTPLKIPTEFDLAFRVQNNAMEIVSVVDEMPHTINLHALVDDKKKHIREVSTTAYQVMLTPPLADYQTSSKAPVMSALLTIKRPTSDDPFTYLTSITLVVSFGSEGLLSPYIQGIPKMFHYLDYGHHHVHETKINRFATNEHQAQVQEILSRELPTITKNFVLNIAPKYTTTSGTASSSDIISWGPMGRFLATSIIVQYFISKNTDQGLTDLEDPTFCKQFLEKFSNDRGSPILKAISRLYANANVEIPFPTIRMILTCTTGITSPTVIPPALIEILKAAPPPASATQRDIMEAEIDALAKWLNSGDENVSVRMTPGIPLNTPATQEDIVTSALYTMMLSIIYDEEHRDVSASSFTFEDALIRKAVTTFNIKEGLLQFTPGPNATGSKYSSFFLFASLSSPFSTITDFIFHHINKETDLLRWLASKIELGDNKRLLNTLGFYGVELSPNTPLVHSHLFFQVAGTMNDNAVGLIFLAPQLDICGTIMLKRPFLLENFKLEELIVLLEQVLQPFDKMLQYATKGKTTILSQPRVKPYLLPFNQKTIMDLKLDEENSSSSSADPQLNGMEYEVLKSLTSTSTSTSTDYATLKQIAPHVFILEFQEKPLKAFVHSKDSTFYEVNTIIANLIENGETYSDLILEEEVTITPESIASRSYKYYSKSYQESIAIEKEQETMLAGKKLATKQLSPGATELFNPSNYSSSSSSSSSLSTDKESDEFKEWSRFVFGINNPSSSASSTDSMIGHRVGHGFRWGGVGRPRYYVGFNPLLSPLFGYPYGYPYYNPYFF